MLTVGLDVGTQGCKAILYEVESKAIKGRGAVSYGLISERQGQAEQDPAVWIQASCASNANLDAS
jgi:xylulokinase